ncbi:hypothetical protein CLV24_1045 [Pontibacter ummariensis]|uniref:Uncharacterized protein n=1 Tax=Pontibacter ummariensis TaxID=1610492 RepID=A0A239D2F2_9BACT|nr:hypothetical protein CLV24_1045 [Pontibacter ummariensis]SNS26198.1 hypothetical protein SAMN06296052_1045 [Pontibacter ummariensis]
MKYGKASPYLFMSALVSQKLIFLLSNVKVVKAAVRSGFLFWDSPF